jgi:hypothetical protein
LVVVLPDGFLLKDKTGSFVTSRVKGFSPGVTGKGANGGKGKGGLSSESFGLGLGLAPGSGVKPGAGFRKGFGLVVGKGFGLVAGKGVSGVLVFGGLKGLIEMFTFNA